MELSFGLYDNFIAVAIPVTFLLLVVSTRYALRNIFRIWSAENSRKYDVSSEITPKDTESNPWTPNQANQNNVENDHNQNDYGSMNKSYEFDNDVDPVQYCAHIQSEVKKACLRATTREMKKKLTDEDLANEREIQRKQLEEIYKLMEQQNDKFGVSTVDDIQQQIKLYL